MSALCSRLTAVPVENPQTLLLECGQAHVTLPREAGEDLNRAQDREAQGGCHTARGLCRVCPGAADSHFPSHGRELGGRRPDQSP